MRTLSRKQFLQEAKVKESDFLDWSKLFLQEFEANPVLGLLLPMVWWKMVYALYLAHYGVSEAAELLCKLVASSTHLPPLHWKCRDAMKQLINDPDCIDLVTEQEINEALDFGKTAQQHLHDLYPPT